MAKRFDVRRQAGFTSVAIACLILLYLPLVFVAIFSFNAGDSISIWEGFSLKWYESAAANERVQAATIRSFLLAASAATVATTVALLAALATTRGGPWRGQGLTLAYIHQPLIVPEIVTGVALLVAFSKIKMLTGYTGLGYLIAAHSAFCIPFALMPIRARLQGMDRVLEQAAADLYANDWQIFTQVTVPLLWPGILSGFMLAFVISLDNVVITNLAKSAGQDTLPTYMLGQLKRIVTPEINAIATTLLVISITLICAMYLVGFNRKSKEGEK